MVEELTIDTLHARLSDGTSTCVDVVEAYLTRIEQNRSGRGLNAVTAINPAVLDEAREADRSRTSGQPVGPLHGVPVLVKDQAETAGIPTSFGSRLFQNYVPTTDATVVARLRKAGALLLGKTTMCDFAAGWFSASSLSDHTRNAYDSDRDAGGSSAGSGAAVGADLCLVAVGEDTGGSIRIPASFNNNYGLRVTTGLIPRTGFSPLVHFQDTAGPMARTVRDLATLLDAMAGYDSTDVYTTAATLNPDVGRFRAVLNDTPGLDRWSVGVLDTAFGDDADPDSAAVNAVVRAAVGALADAGATVTPGLILEDLPGWIARTSVYGKVSKPDLSRFLASRPDAPVHDFMSLYRTGVFHPENDLFHHMAEGPDDVDQDIEYWRMRVNQDHFRRHVLTLFAQTGVDVLVYPTVQVPPPTLTELAEGRWTALTFPTNTVIASQAGLPALSVPVGFTDSGLPVGMEVVARPYAETTLLQLAAGLEAVRPSRRAPQTAAFAGATDGR